MRTLTEYKQIFAKKGWYFCYNEVRKRIFRLRWLRSMSVIEADEEDKMYRYLKRKYGKYKREVIQCNTNPYPNKIWVCWFQGMENAPEIVKGCYQSMQQHCGDREIIVLTEKNIVQYIDFPDYILEKYRKKRFSATHFSDILRISLLAKYGGIWIDATCLLTAEIPDDIANAECFLFKSFLSASRGKMSSWFIAAQPANKIICETRDILYDYWKKENFLKHYFLFHLCFSLIAEANAVLWKKIPVFPNANPHLLQFELFDEYDETRFAQIKNLSFVHKLSYKFPPQNFEQKNTFYEKIIHPNL